MNEKKFNSYSKHSIFRSNFFCIHQFWSTYWYKLSEQHEKMDKKTVTKTNRKEMKRKVKCKKKDII